MAGLLNIEDMDEEALRAELAGSEETKDPVPNIEDMDEEALMAELSGEPAELPIEQKQGVSGLTRLGLKNLLGDSPALQVEYLMRKGKDAKVSKNGQVQVKEKGAKVWNVVDPEGFDLQDVTDLTSDILSGIAETVAATIGFGAGAAAGGIGAIPGAIAGGAFAGMAAESVEQDIGKMFGFRTESDGMSVLESGAWGGLSAAIPGVRAGVKALPAAKEAAKGAIAKTAGKTADMYTGKALEVPKSVIHAIGSEEMDAVAKLAQKEGLVDLFDFSSRKNLDKARAAIGRLSSEADESIEAAGAVFKYSDMTHGLRIAKDTVADANQGISLIKKHIHKDITARVNMAQHKAAKFMEGAKKADLTKEEMIMARKEAAKIRDIEVTGKEIWELSKRLSMEAKGKKPMVGLAAHLRTLLGTKIESEALTKVSRVGVIERAMAESVEAAQHGSKSSVLGLGALRVVGRVFHDLINRGVGKGAYKVEQALTKGAGRGATKGSADVTKGAAEFAPEAVKQDTSSIASRIMADTPAKSTRPPVKIRYKSQGVKSVPTPAAAARPANPIVERLTSNARPSAASPTVEKAVAKVRNVDPQTIASRVEKVVSKSEHGPWSVDAIRNKVESLLSQTKASQRKGAVRVWLDKPQKGLGGKSVNEMQKAGQSSELSKWFSQLSDDAIRALTK